MNTNMLLFIFAAICIIAAIVWLVRARLFSGPIEVDGTDVVGSDKSDGYTESALATQPANAEAGYNEHDHTPLINKLPEKIRGRVALFEGVLYISEDLAGDPHLIDLASILRRHGVVKYEFHKPSQFEEKYAKYSVRRNKGENEIQQLAMNIIADAYAMGASDIHMADLGNFMHVKFRRLGMMCEYTQIEAETGRRLIHVMFDKLAQSGNSASFTSYERLDARIVKRDFLPEGVLSIRVHTEPIECTHAVNGTGTLMLLRLLYDSTKASGSLPQRLEVLGFSEDHSETIDELTRRTGMIIFSGPTGHGKSTALKHSMEGMAENQPEKSYLSVEDPPEYPMKGVYQILVNTKAVISVTHNAKAMEYQEAIAGSMRSDPDVIMLGEIRYPEAAFAAINIALTGHAVWCTVHANNAFGIVTRLETLLRAANVRDPLDMICDPNVLSGLEYQRLVAKLCPYCKKPLKNALGKLSEIHKLMPPKVYQSLLRTMQEDDLEQIYVRGEGCEHCRQLGLVDQTIVAEVVAMNPELLGLLRNHKMPEAIHYWREEMGGKSHIEHARQFIKEGLLDPYTTASRIAVPLDYDKYSYGGSK